jgi:hypothetical protein
MSAKTKRCDVCGLPVEDRVCACGAVFDTRIAAGDGAGRTWTEPGYRRPTGLDKMAASIDPGACFRDRDFEPGDVTASGLPTRETLDEGPPPRPEVDTCRHWLSTRPRTANVRKAAYSYRLKHEVESWAGDYVSNGALIVAAIEMGIAVRRATPSSVNAYLAISVK